MVDVLGHFGVALLWLAPVWFVFDRPKPAVGFIATGFWFGMLPDIDLVLSNWFPHSIHHHGVFHTVLVVTILAVILGPIVGWIQQWSLSGSDWYPDQATDNAYTLGFIAVWVPGLSHVFTDMLSAPGIAPPIEPFWPLYGGDIVHVDVFYYTSVWATWGLLIVGIVVNGLLWRWKK